MSKYGLSKVMLPKQIFFGSKFYFLKSVWLDLWHTNLKINRHLLYFISLELSKVGENFWRHSKVMLEKPISDIQKAKFYTPPTFYGISIFNKLTLKCKIRNLWNWKRAHINWKKHSFSSQKLMSTFLVIVQSEWQKR